MVAFSASDPVGVLIGAKRSSGTLVHKIAIDPDHRRLGHGRHLLESLGSKLAILGPPRIIAEVPETLGAACELFGSSGFVREAILTDYVLECEENGPALTLQQAQGHPERSRGMRELGDAARVEGFVIPVTVDDLAANGLLGEADRPVCWKRSLETLTARKADIEGLAVASDERIEAYLLYVRCGMDTDEASWGEAVEIVSHRCFLEDGGARLEHLLSRLRARGIGTFRFPKVHPAEISKEFLETLGFRPAGGHVSYAATLRPFNKLTVERARAE